MARIDRNEARRSALLFVSVRHLLEHTHGLDDSMIDRAPLRPDGFIDSEVLRAQLRTAQKLADPGALYSYANVGAWLLAAALERCAEQPYETLLRARLLAPLAVRQRSAASCGGPCFFHHAG